MRRSGHPLVLLTCLGLAACAPGPSGSAPAPSATSTDAAPTAIASPSDAAAASVAPSHLIVGAARPATVHVPPGGGTEPAPLILMLHGYGSSPAEHQGYFGIDRVAAERGVVTAYPEGTRDREGNRFWNGTDACCNFHLADVDDVAYLVDVVDEISRATPIDPKRVYLVGHSNGGFMSYRMACEQAGLFAAIVSLAGATFDDDADCTPSRPVAVLQIHGTADDVILFEGGTLDIGGVAKPRRYPGAKATALTWAAYDGCATAFEVKPTTLDLDQGIEGSNEPAETTVEVAKGCGPGSHVELWTIPDGSHVPDLSTSFSTVVIDFLLAHSKP